MIILFEYQGRFTTPSCVAGQSLSLHIYLHNCTEHSIYPSTLYIKVGPTFYVKLCYVIPINFFTDETTLK